MSGRGLYCGAMLTLLNPSPDSEDNKLSVRPLDGRKVSCGVLSCYQISIRRYHSCRQTREHKNMQLHFQVQGKDTCHHQYLGIKLYLLVVNSFGLLVIPPK